MFLLAAPLFRRLGTAEEPPGDGANEHGALRDKPPRRSVLSGARWPRSSFWSSSGALYELWVAPSERCRPARGEHAAIAPNRQSLPCPSVPSRTTHVEHQSHDRSSNLQVMKGARGAARRIRCRVRWRRSACRLTSRSPLGVQQRMPPAAVATVLDLQPCPAGWAGGGDSLCRGSVTAACGARIPANQTTVRGDLAAVGRLHTRWPHYAQRSHLGASLCSRGQHPVANRVT